MDARSVRAEQETPVTWAMAHILPAVVSVQPGDIRAGARRDFWPAEDARDASLHLGIKNQSLQAGYSSPAELGDELTGGYGRPGYWNRS